MNKMHRASPSAKIQAVHAITEDLKAEYGKEYLQYADQHFLLIPNFKKMEETLADAELVLKAVQKTVNQARLSEKSKRKQRMAEHQLEKRIIDSLYYYFFSGMLYRNFITGVPIDQMQLAEALDSLEKHMQNAHGKYPELTTLVSNIKLRYPVHYQEGVRLKSQYDSERRAAEEESIRQHLQAQQENARNCSWGCRGTGRLSNGMRCPEHGGQLRGIIAEGINQDTTPYCLNCGGSGRITQVIMPSEGNLISSAYNKRGITAKQVQRICPTCNGSGKRY